MRHAKLMAVGALLAACTQTTAPPVASGEASDSAPQATVSSSANDSILEGLPGEDPFVAEREALVESGIVKYGIQDPAVIQAMRTVPRHRFVPPEYLDLAYENHPLPIGFGQTISQPYIVALMTEALELEPGDRVLEIGTGSAYQAAVLAELGMEVFSIEIVGPLAESAASLLNELGYTDVHLKHADGYFGWEEFAPFDAIIVTAAPDHVPQPLLSQLEIGGILVIPVGPVGGFQELWRVRRVDGDNFETSSLGGVRFVPLVRDSDSE
jgi:protein-L-isoaspartate(D-aspartate) O-methyltransferase